MVLCQVYERRLKDGEMIHTEEHLDSHRALVAKYLQKVSRKTDLYVNSETFSSFKLKLLLAANCCLFVCFSTDQRFSN